MDGQQEPDSQPVIVAKSHDSAVKQQVQPHPYPGHGPKDLKLSKLYHNIQNNIAAETKIDSNGSK